MSLLRKYSLYVYLTTTTIQNIQIKNKVELSDQQLLWEPTKFKRK